MTRELSDAFTDAVRDRRTDFNERFERARHQYPQLDGDDVLQFLRNGVDEAAAEVQRENAAAVAPLVSAAFDAALALCGQKLVGATGRYPIIAAGWKRLMPAAASHLAREPARVIAAISNALHTLATHPGGRPDEWITSLAQLAPRCADVDVLLRAGQVIAWRSGLAHLRAGALAIAAQLPPAIAAAAVGGRTAGEWPAIRARLDTDAWFDPSQSAAPVAGPRVIKETGDFRGLGGLFLLPPEIAVAEGGWLVSSAGQHWFLAVDAFGATFHRATEQEWGAANRELRLPAGTKLAGAVLTQGSSTLSLPVVGPVTSVAAAGATLAVTSAHTHAVTFVSLS